MRDPRHVEGARALLFERLVDLEPERRGLTAMPRLSGERPRYWGVWRTDLQSQPSISTLWAQPRVGHEPFRIHRNVRALRESVRRELEQLLNTRCSFPLRPPSGAERSVINYGLPDFSSLSASSGDDQNLLQELIRSTVSFFEPRLRDVTVEVAQLARHEQGLAVTIGGVLAVGDVLEPISFPVHFKGAEGVVVNEAETA